MILIMVSTLKSAKIGAKVYANGGKFSCMLSVGAGMHLCSEEGSAFGIRGSEGGVFELIASSMGCVCFELTVGNSIVIDDVEILNCTPQTPPTGCRIPWQRSTLDCSK